MSRSSPRIEALFTHGPAAPTYVIAEIGSNHGGDLDEALALISACAKAGADAVKFQSWVTAQLQNRVDPESFAPDASFPILERYRVQEAWYPALAARCAEEGVDLLSTPFDLDSARLLRDLGVPAIKIASGDLTYTQLLRAVGGFGLPILLSTGMATLDEIETALADLGPARSRTVLLHCIGAYPPAVEDTHLRAIGTLAQRFGLPVGFSDHQGGHNLVVAAVALGARVIEKHVTFSRSAGHPDSPFALEMDELAALVRAVREVECALGDGDKVCRESEAGGRSGGRRSLYWSADLPAGAPLTPEHVAVLRPNRGEFAPADLDRLTGRQLARDVRSGAPVRGADLADG